MRLICANPNLRSARENGAAICRLIADTARERRIPHVTLVSTEIESALQIELAAHKHFHCGNLQPEDYDSESGGLSIFFRRAQETWRDLSQWSVLRDDLLLLFGGPAELMGLVRW